MAGAEGTLSDGQVLVNGVRIDHARYAEYHAKRIHKTLDALSRSGSRRVVELGGHPWAMTAALVDSPRFEVCATVSAEEITHWADDIGVCRSEYMLRTPNGREARFPNYSANLERSRFLLDVRPDAVLACEIIEHLARAPHVMLLNVNDWLDLGGTLVLTTPNGAQFSNPFRRRAPAPAYRCHMYERHHYLYTLDDILDLIRLCGFRVVEAGYWDLYDRTGLPSIYGWLSQVPFRYFQDKFQKTVYVVARKQEGVSRLSRTPRVYVPHPGWEYVGPG